MTTKEFNLFRDLLEAAKILLTSLDGWKPNDAERKAIEETINKAEDFMADNGPIG